MAAHRIYHEAPDPLTPGPLTITGDEAHHAARVKRLEPGTQVMVLDGHGSIGGATLTGINKADRGQWQLVLDIQSVRLVDRPAPRLEVLSAAPKGSRLEDLIDGLSQVGAASWSLLETAHGEVDPRPAKLERLRRTATESSKQCGRPWLLELGPSRSLAALLTEAPPAAIVMADATGVPYTRSGASAIRLLVGPEGGWSPQELQSARDHKVRIARFGPHAMRIETAAIAAAAIILDRES